uniref:Uncharacterized protein n=1 Tax=Anguilla anguilla TaxID=7936 RepID=A0A0E9VWB4_ANGAN
MTICACILYSCYQKQFRISCGGLIIMPQAFLHRMSATLAWRDA